MQATFRIDRFARGVVAAVTAAVAAGACSDGSPAPAPTPSPVVTSPSPSPSPTALAAPAALPTFGGRVLAAASGSGSKSLGPVSGAEGVQVVVSCVGTTVEISVPGAFSTTHDCGDGSASAYEAGPRAGRLTVMLNAGSGTRWRVAVLPGT